MGHSQTEKAQSRERIVDRAAKQIRKNGLQSVSVGKLMSAVGLTHGGFYGHFSSRSELLAVALERAMSEGAESFHAEHPQSHAAFETILRRYLSRRHRDHPAEGCAIAALAGDAARSDEAIRRAMSSHIKAFADEILDSLNGDDRGTALFIIGALVGTLTLSRVLDTKDSDALLAAAKRELFTLDAGRNSH
ncbi:TetR/AcrR family transcriptional regulator [Variovorax atrisoli]|uniref:TetR/AcrR family transcriptional regulator n=1 Tax=Variovorax atrisoli TaxID=3394203 RepID=UPI000F7F25DB|nr:TetR/AcrR family transcriptional regulator [Variovorax sp. 369]RTD88611.1 TetR/AcrR family transcriptional regulator [Variovorax sp. 369]